MCSLTFFIEISLTYFFSPFGSFTLSTLESGNPPGGGEGGEAESFPLSLVSLFNADTHTCMLQALTNDLWTNLPFYSFSKNELF